MYLTPDDVRLLAINLADGHTFNCWILDLHHPRLLGANGRGRMGPNADRNQRSVPVRATRRAKFLRVLGLALRTSGVYLEGGCSPGAVYRCPCGCWRHY
jgi:hypothetical protein